MTEHTDSHSEATTSPTPAHPPVLDFPRAPQSTAVLSRSELAQYLAAARAADGENAA